MLPLMLPPISAKKVYKGRCGRIRLVSPNVSREEGAADII